MKMIVAVDKNWGIGKAGKLPWHIPKDLIWFSKNTTNKTVVMGRKTFDSLPDRKPLKNRVNIVLSKDPGFDPPGIIKVNDIKELFEITAGYDKDDVYIIGGSQIFKLLFDHCDTAIVTKINAAFDVDTFFPDLDINPGWKVVSRSDTITDNGYEICFLTYVKAHGS